MSSPMARPPHACGCMSGLTDRQAILLELAGLLEAVEWKVSQVRSVHEAASTEADVEVIERMLKWQAALTRLQEFCRERGWQK